MRPILSYLYNQNGYIVAKIKTIIERSELIEEIQLSNDKFTICKSENIIIFK